MNQDAEIAQLLELHAALLATDGALAADALAQIADDEVAGLMDVAARVFRALPPVPPDPTFRLDLEGRLERAARSLGGLSTAGPRRKPLQLLRRHRIALAFACGAALGALAGGLAGAGPLAGRRA